MKSITIFKIIGLVLLLLPCSWASAQGQNPHSLNILGQSDGNRVLLRWAPSDYKLWQELIAKGISLDRYTTHINGERNNAAETYNSKLVLSPNLLPISESQWDADFPNNTFGQLAKGALYEEDATIQLSNNPTLADAVNANVSEDSRFLFALFAAEQDFEVAKGMALGFEDPYVQSGEQYLYILKINNPATAFEGVLATLPLDADDRVELPAVEELAAEGMDQVALLEWNIETTKDHYSTYDIEKSTDRVTYVKANDLPFVFGSDTEDDPTYVTFRDSLDDNTTTYYYRVRGRTPFGLQGPPSEPIEVQGIPARLNLDVEINDYHAMETKVELIWDQFNEDFRDHIQGFNVFRSQQSTTGFVLLNSQLLDPLARDFVDNNPLGAAYYHLEAIDKNGHIYPSPAILVQLADSIPPLAPTGFTGNFITPTRVELTWDANTEADLKGYRIMVANRLDNEYTQITNQSVIGERYIYDIEPRFMAENIYFKILATDHRENYSELSEAIEIERPDKIAPSIPLMHKVSPSPEGIRIGFQFSESEDVTQHVLERKPADAPNWEVVLTIPKAEEGDYAQNLDPNSVVPTCYVDETVLERREYHYRFLAYDDQNNAASSDVITVRPYDDGRRGTISSLNAIAECVPLGDVSNPEAYEIIDYLILYYGETGQTDYVALYKLVVLNIITESEYNAQRELEPFEVNVLVNNLKMEILEGNVLGKIFLKWDYDTNEQLTDFQLFRSTEGSNLMLYKTLPADEVADFIYEDEDVRPGRRYFYQIMARHQGGGFSERSELVMVKVPKY